MMAIGDKLSVDAVIRQDGADGAGLPVMEPLGGIEGVNSAAQARVTAASMTS